MSIFKYFVLFLFYYCFGNYVYSSQEDLNKFKDKKYIHINTECKGCLTPRKTNAGCAIFQDNKLLLVKHTFTGKWGFPGGRNGFNGELAFQTAYRETLEETGYRVSIEELIAEFNNNFRLFKCDVIENTNRHDIEISEFKFFTKEEILNLMKNKRDSLRYGHQFDVLYAKWDVLNNK